VASWIEVDTERVAGRLAWLYCMLRCSEGKYLGLDPVDIIDGHVEVELLRPLTGGPGWRGKLVSQLERQAQTVDGDDDPVVLGDGDLPANDSAIELG
jgi:hypothetical protein